MNRYSRVGTLPVAVIFAMALCSCAPGVTVTQLADQPRHVIRTEQVDVYRKAEDVKRQYRQIAVLTADDAGWDYNYSFLEDMLVRRARVLGANGLIMGETEQTGGGGYEFNGTMIVPKVGKQIVKGIAIVYL